MASAIMILSTISTVIFAVIVLPLLCLIPFGWKNEYAPGFCGFGATLYSVIALIPALIAAGLTCVAQTDQRTHLIGVAPAVLLLVVIASVQWLTLWHGRRRVAGRSGRPEEAGDAQAGDRATGPDRGQGGAVGRGR